MLFRHIRYVITLRECRRERWRSWIQKLHWGGMCWRRQGSIRRASNRFFLQSEAHGTEIHAKNDSRGRDLKNAHLYLRAFVVDHPTICCRSRNALAVGTSISVANDTWRCSWGAPSRPGKEGFQFQPKSSSEIGVSLVVKHVTVGRPRKGHAD